MNIVLNDSLNTTLLPKFNYIKKHQTKQLAFDEIKNVSNKLQQKGFIYNTNSTIETDSTINCIIDINHKIESIHIYYDENLISSNFLKRIAQSYTSTYFIIPFTQVENTLEEVTSYFESKGNTFVELSLSDITLRQNNLFVKLEVQGLNKRNIDKIVIKGYPNFPEKLIKNHFQIKKNTLFTKDLIKRVDQQLIKLPYITQTKPTEVLFSNDSTLLYIYVEKKSINSISGILGFSNEENSKKITITGNATIELLNSFNKGEKIFLKWNNTKNNYNDLTINFSTPYIYNTRISPELNFNITKQDSTYITTTFNISGEIQLNAAFAMSPTINFENSSNTSISNNLSASDYKKFFAGLFINYESFLKKLPKITIGAQFGNKKETTSTQKQEKYVFQADYSFPINYRNAILFKHTSEFLKSNSYTPNELFRIGGTSSIRGFDEKTILANQYSITNLEYHFNLDTNSTIYSITDFGTFRNKIHQNSSKLFGIGLGYIVLSQKYLLNLSYAIGKFQNSSFKFNNSKIHINAIYFF